MTQKQKKKTGVALAPTQLIMAASINLSLLVVVLGQAAVTLVAAGPTPTPPEAHAGGVKFGFTPRPTQPPGLGLLGTALQLQHAVLSPLVKRQASDAAICGYESGIESMSFSLFLRFPTPTDLPASLYPVPCRLMLHWQLEYVLHLFFIMVRQQARQDLAHN
jgi:hypothetical protein